MEFFVNSFMIVKNHHDWSFLHSVHFEGKMYWLSWWLFNNKLGIPEVGERNINYWQVWFGPYLVLWVKFIVQLKNWEIFRFSWGKKRVMLKLVLKCTTASFQDYAGLFHSSCIKWIPVLVSEEENTINKQKALTGT